MKKFRPFTFHCFNSLLCCWCRVFPSFRRLLLRSFFFSLLRAPATPLHPLLSSLFNFLQKACPAKVSVLFLHHPRLSKIFRRAKNWPTVAALAGAVSTRAHLPRWSSPLSELYQIAVHLRRWSSLLFDLCQIVDYTLLRWSSSAPIQSRRNTTRLSLI